MDDDDVHIYTYIYTYMIDAYYNMIGFHITSSNIFGVGYPSPNAFLRTSDVKKLKWSKRFLKKAFIFS